LIFDDLNQAEGKGFEPLLGCPKHVFKTCALVHSAIPPAELPNLLEDFIIERRQGQELCGNDGGERGEGKEIPDWKNLYGSICFIHKKVMRAGKQSNQLQILHLGKNR
jgi:hypothetical protein